METLPATNTTTTTATAYLAAHPIGTAVVGGIIIALGAYYLGKYIANRAHKKEVAAPAAA